MANRVRLLGVDYDPHTNALELELGSGDHRAFNPREVWAVEESDGFVSSIQIVRNDGAKELVNITRGRAVEEEKVRVDVHPYPARSRGKELRTSTLTRFPIASLIPGDGRSRGWIRSAICPS